MITRFRCFSWQERWRNLCFVTLFRQFDIIKLKHILPFFFIFFIPYVCKWQAFSAILENFCLCLIQRTLGELPNFGVMIWQLYYMLRSALICFQVTRFRNKGNHFI